jgi:hypothetical protein
MLRRSVGTLGIVRLPAGKPAPEFIEWIRRASEQGRGDRFQGVPGSHPDHGSSRELA